jgi:cation diffusion facilitator family transporter
MKYDEKFKVTLFSVFAALLLTSIKFIVGVSTNSLGILSEALHSGLDLVAAVITFFAVRIADKPADKQHNFGHGKVENFSALIEAILLLATCGWIIHEAIQRLTGHGGEVRVTIWSYIVVLIAIAIDAWRSVALKRVAKKYNNQAIEADALHFSSDILSSLVVLAGLICAQFGFAIADSIAGIVVAIIVIVISIQLAKRAIDSLLDAAPPGITQRAREVLDSNSEILGYHDLRVRSSGEGYFIMVSLHVNSDLTLKQAHDISDRIEQRIKDAIQFPTTVDIHIEPENHGRLENN